MNVISYLERFSLRNKTAYITGASGLLGSEISCALAVAGAKTIMVDIDEEKGKSFEKRLQNDGYDVYYEYFDVTNLQKIESNCRDLYNKFQRIDVWINCAYPRTDD